MNINTGTYGGRLTRDVELKTTSGGLVIANIGLAINRRVKRGDQWENEPVFVDVTMFGKSAEAFAKHHQKGSMAVFPRCELAFDSWEDKKTGGRRTKLYLIAQGWEFVGGGGRRESGEKDDTPF